MIVLATRRRWTDAESKTLREQYPDFRVRGELAVLAKAMQRTKQFICRKARDLGLTDYSMPRPWARTPAEEMLRFATLHETMSDRALGVEFGLTASGVEKRRGALGLTKNPKLVWKNSPHPRGMFGCTHTEVVRARLSVSSTAMWADETHVLNSDAHRQKLSDRSVKMQADGLLRQGYSRGRMGRRADLGGQFFRSAWEANYARYLNFLKSRGQIKDWQYEPDTFWFHEIKRGTRSYLPDFKVLEDGRHYYVEVKGWMDQKSRTKLDRMAKYYPAEEVRLVGATEYRQLRKALSALIPGWERG